MRGALVLFVFLGLSAAAAGSEPGDHVVLRLENYVSTRTATVGDPVHLRTASPVISGGLSIPTGSYVRGVVTRAKRPGRVRGRGQLEIGIVSITLPDGAVLAVTASPLPMEPPRRTVPNPRTYSAPSPTLPILAGMVAGYGTAMLVSRGSNSEDTIARSGVVAGVATGVLVGVLKRGEDLVLRPGLMIDVVFERAVPLEQADSGYHQDQNSTRT
jgi:type IV secretion system protein VirB10